MIDEIEGGPEGWEEVVSPPIEAFDKDAIVLVSTTVSFVCVAEERLVNERLEEAVVCGPLSGVEGLTIGVLVLLAGTGNGASLWKITLLLPVPLLICASMNAKWEKSKANALPRCRSLMTT